MLVKIQKEKDRYLFLKNKKNIFTPNGNFLEVKKKRHAELIVKEIQDKIYPKDPNSITNLTFFSCNLKVDEKSSEKLSDFNDLMSSKDNFYDKNQNNYPNETVQNHSDKFSYAEEVLEEETLSIQHNEIELIIKALEKSKGKRKIAAKELGISERTLYRKIKQYDIEM